MRFAVRKRFAKSTTSIITAACGMFSLVRTTQADTATWINTSSGNWTTPTNWSTNPNYPNNGSPSGVTYAAAINQPGTGPYTVALSNSVSVDSLSINSANATLAQSAGTLTVGSLAVTSGNYVISGTATLSGGVTGATVSIASSNSFGITGGTLDHLTFSGANLTDSASTLTITDGLNFSGNSLSAIGLGQKIYFDLSNQTIDQIGISVATTNAAIAQSLVVGGPMATAPVTLTLGTNATIQGNANISNYITGEMLLNNGTLNANTGGRTLSISTSNFTNYGLAEAMNGGALSINATTWTNATNATINAVGSTLTLGPSSNGGNWSNAGTITATNTSTVNLGGIFSLSGLGTFNTASNTTLNITGTLDNTGNTLALDGSEGAWVLNGGTIRGGTIDNINDFTLKSGTFTGVTIPSGTTLTLPPSGSLTLSGISNMGTINVAYPFTINLGGTVNPSSFTGINASTTNVNITGTYTMGANDTFAYSAALGTPLLQGGTIQGGKIDWSTNPVLHLVSGTLNGVTLAGTPDTQYLSSLTIDNNLTGTGQAFNIPTYNASIYFDGNNHLQNIDLTSYGGNNNDTLLISGGSATSPPTLTIDVNARIDAGDVLYVKDMSFASALVNNGTITAQNAYANMSVQNSYFTNNGSILITNTFSAQNKISFINNGTVTSSGLFSVTAANWNNAAGATIDAANPNSLATLTLGAANSTGVNNGMISLSHAVLNLAGNWTNAGTISATNSTLNFGGTFTLASVGTITTSGSTVNITGILNMSPTDLLALNASTGSWNLSGGTINGGTVNCSGGATLSGINATLNGVSFQSDFSLTNGTLNNISMNGHVLTLTGSAGFPTSQTLDNVTIIGNSASIAVGGAPPPYANVNVTFGTNVIFDAGGITSILGTNFINNGQLIQDGNSLTIQNTSYTNNNLTEILDGGTATVASTTSFTNNGSIVASGLNSRFTVNSANWVNPVGGTISANQQAKMVIGGTFTNLGAINVDNSTLVFNGTWTNSGTITATNKGIVSFTSAFTLASVGSITASADSSIEIDPGGSLVMQPTDVFTFSSSTGSWNLNGGAVVGGTLNFTDGKTLNVLGGTLDGIHFESGDLNASNGVFITDGLTGDGHKLNASYAITFGGVATQTIDNMTVNPEYEFYLYGVNSSSPGTLVIGPGAVVTSADVYQFSNGSSIINKGSISFSSIPSITGTVNISNSGTATFSGALRWISGSTFTNTAGAATFSSDAGPGAVPILAMTATGGTISLASTQHLTSLSISGGSIVSVARANGSTTRSVLVVGALNFAGSTNAWQGQLNLSSNDLIVHGGNIADITNQIDSGYDLNTFAGAGITSSTAANDATHLSTLGVLLNVNALGGSIYSSFDNQTVSAGDVLVKYTYYGDANLDGQVDGSDYTIIDNGYNHLGTLTGWYNGDFNYDGKIDGSDYTLIDNAFNTQGGNLSSTALIADATAQLAGDGTASVPEPTSIALAAVGGVGLLRRRRCGCDS